MPLSREEIAALDLPVERHCVSITPRGQKSPCVYRYATEEQADNHLKAEKKALEERKR